MPPYSCRYICAKQQTLDVYTSDHRNPAEAAQEAENFGAGLTFAVIEVWDGTNKVLVWKRAREWAGA